MKAEYAEFFAALGRARGKSLRGGPPVALFGLDGYIDSLYTVVRGRDGAGEAECFRTLEQFLDRLRGAQRRSADQEILLKSRRAGGNAPLTAGCLSRLGFYARCVGLFGEGGCAPPFSELAGRCELISLGPPAKSISLEFSDCKLMFGELEALRALTLERLLERLDERELTRFLEQSRLISFLNWAGTPHLTGILSYLTGRILERMDLGGKTVLFDFSDIRARRAEDFLAYLEVIAHIAGMARVVVSLNENEAEAAACFCGLPAGPPGEVGEALRNAFGVQAVVIHALDGALAFEAGRRSEAAGFYMERPAITTGGGDNFNGGLCAGLLLKLPMGPCLTLANAAARYYVAHGESGTLDQVVADLRRRIAAIG